MTQDENSENHSEKISSIAEEMLKFFLPKSYSKSIRSSKRAYCAFCGKTYRVDLDVIPKIQEHLFSCEKHPMRDLESKILELNSELDKLSEFHPRAMKLLNKRKNFLVIASDEPYFSHVYDLIRSNEKRIERWTEEDEIKYQQEISNIKSSDLLCFDPNILSQNQLMQLLAVTDEPKDIAIIQSYIHRRRS